LLIFIAEFQVDSFFRVDWCEKKINFSKTKQGHLSIMGVKADQFWKGKVKSQFDYQ
jgi:hypothetical protein